MSMQSLVGPGVDPVGAAAVDQMLADGDLASVHYVVTTGSTNDDAKRFVRDSAATSETVPRLFLADQQTAGRGRHGRVWTSDPSSLTFSLLVRQPWDPRLSLAVGVAVAESIESVHPDVSIGLKWPNDLWIGQSKLAGILIEAVRPATASRTFAAESMSRPADEGTGGVAFQVIGVGINLGTSPPAGVGEQEAWPSASPVSSTSKPHSTLPVSLGSAEHRFVWLPRFIQSIQDWMRILAENPGDVIEGFAARCVLRGHPIETLVRGTRVHGTCLGVDRAGRLRLATGDSANSSGREITLESGEVRRVVRQDSKSS